MATRVPKRSKAIKVLNDYDIAADAKNRISLRGAKAKYFHVKALSNGCYVLEPRILVAPEALPARRLKMREDAVAARKKGKTTQAVMLPELPPGESAFDKILPILKKTWTRRGRGKPDLATNSKYLDGLGE